MQVIVVPDKHAVAKRTSEYIVKYINKKPNAVLGLATGETPVLLYDALIRTCKKGDASFKNVVTFNLDEYIGIAPEHSRSYRYFMERALFRHIDIKPENTFLPDGYSDFPHEASKQYEHKIHRYGGIDLQILGIGGNGHIGFNEPSSSLSSRTRIKSLTKQTVFDNARFFQPGEFQPIQAITMGIQTIMEAGTIILMAFGDAKKNSIKNMVEGAVSSSCPASALQYHNKTVLVIDAAAASQLEHIEYYKHVDDLTRRSENFFPFIDI